MKAVRLFVTVILVLGGVRSGKSVFADRLAEEHGQCVYLTTTEHEGMARRIEAHRGQRKEGWHTVEVPTELTVGSGRRVRRRYLCWSIA